MQGWSSDEDSEGSGGGAPPATGAAAQGCQTAGPASVPVGATLGVSPVSPSPASPSSVPSPDEDESDEDDFLPRRGSKIVGAGAGAAAGAQHKQGVVAAGGTSAGRGGGGPGGGGGASAGGLAAGLKELAGDNKVDGNLSIENEEDVDEDLLALPPTPEEGEADPELEARIAARVTHFLALKHKGRHLNGEIEKAKDYSNPYLLKQIVGLYEIDEYATNFPPEKFDPRMYRQSSEERQKSGGEAREAEAGRVTRGSAALSGPAGGGERESDGDVRMSD